MEAVSKKTIQVPIDRVWAVLADHEGMASWAPGLKVSLSQEGSSERNGVGAVRQIKAPGPAPAIVEEVTGFEPNKRLAYRALSGVPMKNYNGEVTLTPTGRGTEIRYAVRADARVPVVEKAAAKGVSLALLSALVRAAKRA